VLCFALLRYRGSLRSPLEEREICREVPRAAASEVRGEMRGDVRSENTSEVAGIIVRLTARQPDAHPAPKARERRVAVRRLLIISSHPTTLQEKQHTYDSLSKISLRSGRLPVSLTRSEILDPALEDVVCANSTNGAGSAGDCLRPHPTTLREPHVKKNTSPTAASLRVSGAEKQYREHPPTHP